MQWFRDVKVGIRISALIVIMVIFLTGLGAIGHLYITELSHAIHSMYAENLLPVKNANAMRGQTRAVEAMVMGILSPLTDKSTEAMFIKEITERTTETNRLLDELTKAPLDKTAVEKLDKIKIELDFYREQRQKSIELATSGQKEAAHLYFKNNAVAHLDAINILLKELADYLAEQSDKADSRNASAAQQAKSMILGLSILAIVLAITIGITIARSIVNPIRSMNQAIETDANGYVTIKTFEVNSRDEIGQLGLALNTLLKQVREFVHKANQASEQVAASSEELTANAEQSAGASNQVAISVSEAAQTVDKQAHTVRETMGIIEQVSAGAQQVAANAGNMANIAEQSAKSAQAGTKTIEAAISQMGKIETTVNQSAAVVTTLGERSKEIGQIVDAIAGIAGQTNLLALNAAIEAARAGEQGRGFAVVAEEVRKLAEQSGESARQIAELITSIQADTDQAVISMRAGTQEVKRGSEVVGEAGKSFGEIQQLGAQVLELVREAAAATQQIAGGSQQIVYAMRDIEKGAQEIAGGTQSVSAATEEQSAAMQEIASASQSLAQMAQELQEAVQHFKV